MTARGPNFLGSRSVHPCKLLLLIPPDVYFTSALHTSTMSALATRCILPYPLWYVCIYGSFLDVSNDQSRDGLTVDTLKVGCPVYISLHL